MEDTWTQYRRLLYYMYVSRVEEREVEDQEVEEGEEVGEGEEGREEEEETRRQGRDLQMQLQMQRKSTDLSVMTQCRYKNY